MAPSQESLWGGILFFSQLWIKLDAIRVIYGQVLFGMKRVIQNPTPPER